jgi:polysaccharide deacetylase family protein (PEP-CTERM system associated)
MLNIISVDVEDYFHPTEVGHLMDPKDWGTMLSRVEGATGRVLDVLAEHGTTATFFILGWVAEHHPQLVRRIAGAGHEIACHSYSHRLVFDLTPEEFRADTMRALNVIGDACGRRPTSYRAPSYSIVSRSLWALEILVELGFTHDSSIYPIPHDRYGIPGFSRHAKMVETPSGPIMEVPIATVALSENTVVPVGGGAYLRLLPYRYTAAGIRRINERERQPACIYLHPWEMDPGQPRLAKGWVSRVRTYAGLSGMEAKLSRLLSEFQFGSLSAVHNA